MRKRSYTSINKLEPKYEDVREELQTLKMEHSILQQKHQELQSERNILKEGNSNLISQFLFDKHRQELNRLSDSLKQKNQEITELKKLIEDFYKILNEPNGTNTQRKQNQLMTYEHSSKFSIRITDEKKVQSSWGKKGQVNMNEVKQSIVKVKENYEKQMSLNKKLQEQNVELGKEIQFLRSSLQQINYDLQRSSPQDLIKNNEELVQKVQDITQELQELKKQNSHLNQLFKQNEEQSKIKQKQLITQNKELSERIKQLDREVKLRKSSFENYDQKLPNLSFKSSRFQDQDINMSVSICNTEDMKKSLIYQKLSESCMQQSIVTESYDKRLLKLQKTNVSLQKDYNNSQQKIKSLNREYSKLKLDYLKLSEDWKLREDQFQKRIQILNNKLQTSNKRAKQHQTILSSIKIQKEKEKSTFKNIILSLEQKEAESENQIERRNIQIQCLKEQLESTEKVQQMKTLNNSQLQNEKNKNKSLEKELQKKSRDFQKTLKQYELLIEDMRKINGKQRQDSRNKVFTRTDQKSLSKINRSSESLISPYKQLNQTASSSDLNIKIQSHVILKALKTQIQVLQSNLKLQNQRYNILENSNKELRKQLLKMIDHQQKLRKDLINERIKAKTKSISSKNSRVFLSRRLKEDFSEQKTQRQMNQCQSNFQLPIGAKQQRQNIYQQRNTDRSCNSVQLQKTLYPSHSNLQLKIQTNQRNLNEAKNLQGSNQGSYLKAMREKRFDPKQTSNAFSVKQSSLTDRNPQIIPTNESFTERKNVQPKRVSYETQHNNYSYKNKESIVVSQIYSPVTHKTPAYESYKTPALESYKTPTSTTKKNLNEINSAQTRSSVNAKKENQKQDKKVNQIPSNESKKYVYQPPKKYIPGLTMVTSITKQNEKEGVDKKPCMIIHDERQEELISLSNDNRQITLEISSSKSNCSKVDVILESNTVQSGYEKNERSKSIKGPQSDRKIQFTEPTEQIGKQVKKNIILAGKIKSTQSNAEVKFMRKN